MIMAFSCAEEAKAYPQDCGRRGEQGVFSPYDF